jgi:hypothetical protein
MTHDERLEQRAAHETVHAAYAVHVGIELEDISIRPQGNCHVYWPLLPGNLWHNYRVQPEATVDRLRAIVGMLLAPEVVHDIETAGLDLQHLANWGARWTLVTLTRPHAPTWRELLEQSWADVQCWAKAGGRREQLTYLSRQLLKRGRVTGKEWGTLMDFAAPGAAARDAAMLATTCTWRNESWNSSYNAWRDCYAGAGMPGLALW